MANKKNTTVPFSLSCGSLLGVPIRLHASLILLPFLLARAGWDILIILLLILPPSILLHELGHCKAAMQFGYRVRDIILTPIGGLARIHSHGMKPHQEAWMAAAGPLVSLLLALGSGLLFKLFVNLPYQDALTGVRFTAALLAWSAAFNFVLLLFNLIPAFPMDGGRILRALLGFKFPLVRATRIAVTISRIICAVFVFMGLFPNPLFPGGNPSLMFIGIIIFWLSGAEYRQAVQIQKIEDIQKQINENSVTISPPPFGGEEDQAPLSPSRHHRKNPFNID